MSIQKIKGDNNTQIMGNGNTVIQSGLAEQLMLAVSALDANKISEVMNLINRLT